MEFSTKLAVVLLGLLACAHEGLSLTCYLCANPNDPRCTGVVETQCIYPQDTCMKYDGNFKDARGILYTDRIIRTCGQYSKLHAISPRIDYDRCASVIDAYDRESGNTYSGKFCLCDDNYCNSSSLMKTSVAVIVFALALSAMNLFC